MPFDVTGVWREPTEEDLIELKNIIEMPEDKVNRYGAMPPELIEEIKSHRLKMQAKKASNKTQLTSVEKMIRGNLKPVDIILPVYGALPHVEACINSIFDCTNYPYKLTIINDASPDPMVKLFLDKIEKTFPDVRILHNKRNKGFAGTVNRGILNSVGHYICILNSDVIVTKNWLTKMVMALEADPKNQIVNPATNNTALINVPMAPGMSYLDMNEILEVSSDKRYPEIMPTGFCFMFRRGLTDLIGMLDEGYGSYGEESDFWFKAIRSNTEGVFNNYRAVLADDTFVFHERGSSFAQLGDDEHMGIRKTGNDRFHALNPDYSQWASTFDAAGSIGPVRESVVPELIAEKQYKYNIAWVVNSTSFCGGMKYISDIVNKLLEQGVNAKVVCVPQTPQSSRAVLPQLHTSPIFFDSEEDFIENFSKEVFSEGIIVAAVGQVVNIVKEVADKHINSFRTLHHIQSYDPILAKFVNPDRQEEMEKAIGVLDNTICSSHWIAKFKYSKVPAETKCISPGVETEIFHPRDRGAGDERPTICVYMSSEYNFKGYDRGVEICKALWNQTRKEGKEIRLIAVGALSVPECPYVIGLGKLNPGRLAQVLANEVDVFVDPAYVHSYGLPCLEALASGARAVCYMNGGVSDYMDSFKDSLTVVEEQASIETITKEIFNQLNKPRVTNIRMPKDHTRRESVNSFIGTLDETFQTVIKNRKITVITPHLRKHGGPSTIVNLANILSTTEDVNLTAIYDDFNQELINASLVPINVNWNNDERTGDIIIVNSDNPHSDYFANHPGYKHKILLKLSHNARFKELEEKALNQDWDRIITSSEWLREACIVKKHGWEHKEWPKEKVTRVGWYHYSHHIFDCGGIKERQYGSIQNGNLKIGMLVHQHPLKGSAESMQIFEALREEYRNNIKFFGLGEVKSKVPSWFQYFKSLNRKEMANVFQQADIWISSSHTEGLGRMMLEAQSAGVCVVASKTGAEFLKDGENCFLFDVGNTEEAVTKTKQLIDDLPTMARIASNGYRTAVEHSSPWAYSSKLHEVVEEVLKNG